MKTTLDELQAFRAVIDCGSITAAAEQLGQTTSGISRSLSRLERKLATTLVRRTTRSLELTEEGARFLARTREVIEICRKAWRREKVVHDGKKYQIPLPADQGTGLGKPLKLINHPVRSTIPIVLAALGPKNVELAAEVANGWQPLFFHPEKAHLAWGDALAAGRAKRDPSLGELDVYAGPALAICDEAEVPFYLDLVRPHLALYIGGMGARGKNFYNELACRYGYEDEAARIQDLYLDGKKEEAAAAVPDELVRSVSLIGPAGYVAERVEAFREAGATTLTVVPMALDAPGRLRLVEQFREMC